MLLEKPARSSLFTWDHKDEGVARTLGVSSEDPGLSRALQEFSPRMLQVLASRKLRPLVSQGLMPDIRVSPYS